MQGKRGGKKRAMLDWRREGCGVSPKYLVWEEQDTTVGEKGAAKQD